MKLKPKKRLSEIKDFAWHCGFCGEKVPIKSKFVLSLYIKRKLRTVVCEYWCLNCGIITRIEYQVKNLKRSDEFIKKMNVYTDTFKK